MQYPQTKAPGSGDQLGGPYGLSIQNIRDVAGLFAQQPHLFWQMCKSWVRKKCSCRWFLMLSVMQETVK